MKLTSSKQGPLAPIHSQQDPRPETDALRKIHTSPQIHSQQPSAKIHAVEVEDRCVTNVSQTAHMLVFESFVDRFVIVATLQKLGIGFEARGGVRELVEFFAYYKSLVEVSLEVKCKY